MGGIDEAVWVLRGSGRFYISLTCLLCCFISRADFTGHDHLFCASNCFLLVHGPAYLRQDDAILNSDIEKLGVTGLGCCAGSGRSHSQGIDFSVSGSVLLGIWADHHLHGIPGSEGFNCRISGHTTRRMDLAFHFWNFIYLMSVTCLLPLLSTQKANYHAQFFFLLFFFISKRLLHPSPLDCYSSIHG